MEDCKMRKLPKSGQNDARGTLAPCEVNQTSFFCNFEARIGFLVQFGIYRDPEPFTFSILMQNYWI